METPGDGKPGAFEEERARTTLVNERREVGDRARVIFKYLLELQEFGF